MALGDDGMTLADWELKLAQVNVAIEQVLQNRAFTIDDVTYSRTDLKTLMEFQDKCRAAIQDWKDAQRNRGQQGPKVRNVVLV